MIKVIDFGISKTLTSRGLKKDMLTMTGTLFYKAPEMFNGGGYDERVDIWALGITIYELVAKKTPFADVYTNDTIDNIMKGEFNFQQPIWKEYSAFAQEVITKMLKPKEERISLKEAKKHLWFTPSDLPLKNSQMTRSGLLTIPAMDERVRQKSVEKKTN